MFFFNYLYCTLVLMLHVLNHIDYAFAKQKKIKQVKKQLQKCAEPKSESQDKYVFRFRV